MELTHYRNYKSQAVQFGDGLTVLFGDNAQGKSNLLEAAYLLAIGKPHRAPTERELIEWGVSARDGYAVVTGIVEHGGDQDDLLVGFDLRGGEAVQKRISINGVRRRASDLVGRLNAVLFSASDIDLVYGGPSGRRRYLDILLSQVSRRYLQGLQRYQRVLQQRNTLLRRMRDEGADEAELAYWDGQICREAAEVLAERHAAVADLAPFAAHTFVRLAGRDGLTITYTGVGMEDGSSVEDIAEAVRLALAAQRRRERAMGQTVAGPHRDDLRIELDGVEIGKHASRGQARLAALSLRLAEANLLRARRDDAPVLLLDDLLSELDAARRKLVMESTDDYHQTLLTTADLALVPEPWRDAARLIEVRAGQLYEEGTPL